MQLFRLSADRRENLRWLWNDAEAELGLRSNSGAVIDVLTLGLHNDGGGRRTPDVMPASGERARRRAWAEHRILQRLQAEPGGIRHVGILYRVYGPYHWRSPFGHFKPAELAPIVEDTEIVASVMALSPTLSKSGAVEQILRAAKKAGPATIRRLEQQASDLLTGASLAYHAAADTERAAVRRAREQMDDRLRAVVGVPYRRVA